jgi:hypothetical protein
MHTTDKYAKGGMMCDLKEDDYVWNEVGMKLIVDKVTKDEYYLTSFGQWGASPFSKSKVNSYLKSGKWSLKPKKQEIMAKGGMMARGGNLKAIAKAYEENEDVNAHSENVVLLAKHFGSADDLEQAKEILERHNKEGHLTSENGRKRYELHKKLIDKARKEMAKENIKFAKGGAIYEGDKVKIKDSGKKMVVKDISKGRKGYVEFSGDAGTYLKGDLEKMAKGGAVPVENSKMLGKTITIQLPTEVKPFKDKVIIEYGDFVMGNKGFWSKEYIVKKSEDGGMMAKGGKTKQDPPIVRGYFEDEPYEYGQGGSMAGWCYSIGGL